MQDVAHLLCGKEEGTGEDLGHRQQVELERSNHTEAAAAPTQRPEQIGPVLGIDTNLLAARGHQLDCAHPVTSQPVLASVKAESATKCVASDAHILCRA